MKKVIFTTACLAIACSGFAQFEKGTILLSGETGMSLSAQSIKAKDNGNSTKVANTTSFSFSPAGGYFVIDNLAVGLNIDLATSKTKYNSDDSEFSSTSFSFGPFARYYITKGLFGELAFGVGSQKDKDTFDGDTDEDKSSLFRWSLGAGYAVMISDQVAFEPSIGYVSTAAKPDGGDGKIVQAGLAINVGVSVYLGKK
jgi:outer membrane protein